MAKSLQSCPTLCDPIDGSPPGSPVPGVLQARTLEWVAISFSNAWKWKVKRKSLSHVRFFTTPWTAAYQAPLSMGFARQEYWRRVPSPSPNPALLSFKTEIQRENWWKKLTNEDTSPPKSMLLLDGGNATWGQRLFLLWCWNQDVYLVNKASSFRHMKWCKDRWKLASWTFVACSFIVIYTYWMKVIWETVLIQIDQWTEVSMLWNKNKFQ